MKARIRYVKQADTDWMLSTSSFNASDGQVRAMIDPQALRFKIVPMGNEEPLVEGTGVNSHDLKKKVKAQLKEMGVEFAPEKRYRNTNELQAALAEALQEAEEL